MNNTVLNLKMTILAYKNYNDLSVFTTVVYICVQHIALWIFIRKCECLDFKKWQH